MDYNYEPLHIHTPVPYGTYEVTVTVSAHEDIIFSVLAQSQHFMAQDIELKKGCTTDITFNINYHKSDCENTDGINVHILCDGDFSAISAVSPVSI